METEEETVLKQFDCINKEYLKLIWDQDFSNIILGIWIPKQKSDKHKNYSIYIRNGI